MEDIMLTAEGCRQRRLRLWELLDPKPDTDHLRLADPLHLRYLANFGIDPFNLNADYGGILLARRDGAAKLITDNRVKSFAEQAHVEDRVTVPWYDGKAPGRGPRELAAFQGIDGDALGTMHLHDRPEDAFGQSVFRTIAQMRRQKDPDEIALLNSCMRATEAGHAWARTNIRPGMTELDVYLGVFSACARAAGHPVIVYGDFAVSPGPERRGGAPTDRVLQQGDLFILDYSVVIDGYRSDFTNTLAVGGQPSPDQRRLFDLCCQAQAAGERELRAGQSCQAVYDAIRAAFDRAGMAEHFPHHAGHGIGLMHPEAPYFVRQSEETLLENDVVTLEPGLYVPGIGGIRIEHNYRITPGGYERLSHHVIALTAEG
jgi:Xaa-Pro aminopeptidase